MDNQEKYIPNRNDSYKNNPDLMKHLENYTPPPLPVPPMPQFSFFRPPIRNIYPSFTITLAKCHDYIYNPYYLLDRTLQFRAIQDPVAKKQFKETAFPYVTFSGIFKSRSEKNLVQHSGLMVLDFDHVQGLESFKYHAFADPQLDTAMAFTSPSGDGVKLVIPIDITAGTHIDYFFSLQTYFIKNYNQKPDISGKDVCRACFLCHDPGVLLNPSYNDFLPVSK